MTKGKITCLLVIFQAIVTENKVYQERNSFISKLVNQTNVNRSQNLVRNSEFLPNLTQVHLIPVESHRQWRYKCANKSDASPPGSAWKNQARFINIDEYSSDALRQMETLVGKSADFDLIMEEDDGNENLSDDEKDYNSYKGEDDEKDEDAEEEEEEEEEDDEEYGFNILDGDDKPSKTKTKVIKGDDDEDEDDEDDTPQLKHVFKHKLKMKDFMFLLLLAYKLKFVTLIPLFLGALILLVGTTSMAGFFFALFSAALGLQSKSHHR